MINQFRTVDDLREEIKELENILMRPTPHLSHPALYRKRDVSEGEVLIKGVRVKDWCLSEDLTWVLPHDQMGLSFSATFSNLKSGTNSSKNTIQEGPSIYIGFWSVQIYQTVLSLFRTKDPERKLTGF